MHSTGTHSTDVNVFIFQMERLRERKGENGLFSCRGKLILEAELGFRNLHSSSVLSQQPGSTRQDQFHRADQFLQVCFVCVHVRCAGHSAWQTLLALLGTSSCEVSSPGCLQS